MSLSIRTLISSASVVIGLALAPWPVQAQDHHIVMPPDQVKFGPAPPALPAGARIAVLAGRSVCRGPRRAAPGVSRQLRRAAALAHQC